MFKIQKKIDGYLDCLSITKGDTAKFTVTVLEPRSKQEYLFDEKDNIKFIVKKLFTDKNPIIEIFGTFEVDKNIAEFLIKSEDTIDVALGKYLCFIVLETYEGDIHTIVVPECENLKTYIPNFIICGGSMNE